MASNRVSFKKINRKIISTDQMLTTVVEHAFTRPPAMPPVTKPFVVADLLPTWGEHLLDQASTRFNSTKLVKSESGETLFVGEKLKWINKIKENIGLHLNELKHLMGGRSDQLERLLELTSEEEFERQLKIVRNVADFHAVMHGDGPIGIASIPPSRSEYYEIMSSTRTSLDQDPVQPALPHDIWDIEYKRAIDTWESNLYKRVGWEVEQLNIPPTEAEFYSYMASRLPEVQRKNYEKSFESKVEYQSEWKEIFQWAYAVMKGNFFSKVIQVNAELERLKKNLDNQIENLQSELRKLTSQRDSALQKISELQQKMGDIEGKKRNLEQDASTPFFYAQIMLLRTWGNKLELAIRKRELQIRQGKEIHQLANWSWDNKHKLRTTIILPPLLVLVTNLAAWSAILDFLEITTYEDTLDQSTNLFNRVKSLFTN